MVQHQHQIAHLVLHHKQCKMEHVNYVQVARVTNLVCVQIALLVIHLAVLTELAFAVLAQETLIQLERKTHHVAHALLVQLLMQITQAV